MTALAFPLVDMHPWFRAPTLKRKSHSTDSTDSSASDHDRDGDELDQRDSASVHTSKRRRCDLENGIAQLSLDPSLQPRPDANLNALWGASFPSQVQPSSWNAQPTPFPPSQPQVPYIPSSMPTAELQWNAAAAYPVVFPGTVEEPTSPASASSVKALPGGDGGDFGHVGSNDDVRMHGQPSWYEPEKDRIVITDLDASDSENEGDDGAELSVNSALLSRIRTDHAARSLAHPNIPISPPPASSLDPSSSKMALVLFRPLPPPSSSSNSPPRPLKEYQDRTLPPSPPSSPPQSQPNGLQVTHGGGPTEGYGRDIADEPIVTDEDIEPDHEPFLHGVQQSPSGAHHSVQDDDDAMDIEYL